MPSLLLKKYEDGSINTSSGTNFKPDTFPVVGTNVLYVCIFFVFRKLKHAYVQIHVQSGFEHFENFVKMLIRINSMSTI